MKSPIHTTTTNQETNMAEAAKKTATKAETNSKANELALTAAQQKAVDNLSTVSARIRYLDGEGYTRGQITKLIKNASGGDLRYQHVRNVLVTPVTKPKS